MWFLKRTNKNTHTQQIENVRKQLTAMRIYRKSYPLHMIGQAVVIEMGQFRRVFVVFWWRFSDFYWMWDKMTWPHCSERMDSDFFDGIAIRPLQCLYNGVSKKIMWQIDRLRSVPEWTMVSHNLDRNHTYMPLIHSSIVWSSVWLFWMLLLQFVYLHKEIVGYSLTVYLFPSFPHSQFSSHWAKW